MDNKEDTVSWREAIMHFEAARTLNGKADVHTLLSQVWVERGVEQLHAGDTISALEALTRAIASDPESAEPLNLAGIVYFRTGRRQKAQLLFERAIQMDSTNSSSVFNLGMVHWEQHHFVQAHDFWLRALKLVPKDEEFLYWFAAAEKKLRSTDADHLVNKEEAE
jgi:Tfp pilus assembly protein PilF